MSSPIPGGMQTPTQGPPYPIPAAQLGGIPNTSVDVPICAVLIPIFLTAALTNLFIFHRNRSRGHKFFISAIVFGFCAARINASILRIAFAYRPKNVRLNIAASIFFNAGVLIFFIVNLIFCQRIVRAYHPQVGWSKGLGWAFKFLYFGVFACFAMVITSVPYGFFTLDEGVQLKLRDIRRVSAVYMAILAFIPLPATIICILAPRRGPIENFGTGSMKTKVFLVLFTTSLLAIGAIFRAGNGFMTRPIDNPGWFNHRAAYYCFNYMVEIIVVYTYTLSRYDKRFWVPNGSKQAGDYSSEVSPLERLAHSGEDEVELREDRRPTLQEQRSKEQVWEESMRFEMGHRQSVY